MELYAREDDSDRGVGVIPVMQPRSGDTIRDGQSGAPLREFLAQLYGEDLEDVLALQPGLAHDVDKPVERIWVRGGCPGPPNVAVLAGTTIVFNYPNVHLVDIDPLSDIQDPKEGWLRLWPRKTASGAHLARG